MIMQVAGVVHSPFHTVKREEKVLSISDAAVSTDVYIVGRR